MRDEGGAVSTCELTDSPGNGEGKEVELHKDHYKPVHEMLMDECVSTFTMSCEIKILGSQGRTHGKSFP